MKSIKSVIARICKIGELRVIRKDRVKPSTQKSTWWYVLHAKESRSGNQVGSGQYANRLEAGAMFHG